MAYLLPFWQFACTVQFFVFAEVGPIEWSNVGSEVGSSCDREDATGVGCDELHRVENVVDSAGGGQADHVVGGASNIFEAKTRHLNMLRQTATMKV